MTEPRVRAAGLDARADRLPVRVVHERDRVQPDRHDAADPDGEVLMATQALAALSRSASSSRGPSTSSAERSLHAIHPAPIHTAAQRRKIDWELIACGFERPRAGRHRRGRAARRRTRWSPASTAASAGTAACAATAGCALAAARAARRASIRRTATRSTVPLRGKALRDKVVLRLIAIDRAFHFLILVLLGIGVLLFAGQRDEPARRLLPDPHRPPGRRRRRPGADHAATSGSCTSSTSCSRCARGRCARSGSRCWPTACSKGSRRSACGSPSAGPST